MRLPSATIWDCQFFALEQMPPLLRNMSSTRKGKADVRAAFLEKIDAVKTPEEARAAFPELEKIWQSIFDLVEKHAGEQYLYRYEQLMRDDI